MMLRLPRPIEKEARIPFVATTVNKDVGEPGGGIARASILPLYIYAYRFLDTLPNEIFKFP